MPITQNGDGQIIYSKPEKEREFEETQVARDNDFAIADKINVLKQIQFDINPTTSGAGTLTIVTDIAGDQTINLTSVAATNSFATIQPDTGTSPTADSANDTLSITSSDGSVVVSGDSTTDTINLSVGQLVETKEWLFETPYDRTYILDLSAKYAYTVQNATVKTDSGTATLAFTIEGVNITSMSAVAASSVEATATSSAANSVAIGNTVALVVSSSAAPDNLAITLQRRRA